MQVTIEDVSAVEKKVDVVIPWDRVKTKLDEQYRQLGKRAKLKGFRPGKVPRNILEKLYGKDVNLEVAKALVQESFVEVAREQELKPVADPVVQDASIKFGENFHYVARVEVRGEFEPKDYKGLKVERRTPKVDPARVDHELEHLRIQYAKFKAIEGREETTPTDVLLIKMEGKIGDMPVDQPEFEVDLGHTEHEAIPGLAKALTGVPLNLENRELELPTGADDPRPQFAGKTAALKVSIKQARERLVPALDDEFAKDTGEADTVAELRTKIEGKLKDAEQRNVDREVREEIVKELTRLNPIAVASALVDRQVEVAVNRVRINLAMQGRDWRQAQIDTDKLRPDAEQEVRATLLLDAIADKESVEVSEADIDKRIAEMAVQQKKPAPKVRAELEKEGRISGLRFAIREEKTLDLLLTEAKISAKE